MPKFYESIRKEVQVIDDEVSTIAQDINSLSSAVAAVSTPISDITKGASLALATAAISVTVPLTTITRGASLAIATAGLASATAVQTIDNEISSLSDDMNSLSSAIATVDNEISTIAEVIRKGTGTEIASNKSLIDAIGMNGTSTLNDDYGKGSLIQFMHGMYNEAVILFVIPEAVGSINAHNSAILTELEKVGEVLTITQADALAYPDFESITMCVLGTDNGTAWTLSNLADIKIIPNLPLLSCDSSTAAYFEIGTDGGDAAAKTAINAIANIGGTILGTGFHSAAGLAVGANTVSSSTIYNTLDMSNANITETWYAYESVNANTDVVLGEVRRIQPDGSLGIDETGAEVPATMAFYGCGYSFNDLNTLGKAVFRLLCEKLIFGVTIGSSLTIAGDIGDLETKTFGNMSNRHTNAVPLAAFISGNSGGTGTELPNSKSLYDVQKDLSAAIVTIDNEVSTIDNQLSTVLQRQNVLSSAIDAVSTPITDITKGCSNAIASVVITASVLISNVTKGCSLAIATAGIIQTIDNEISTIDAKVDGLSTAIQRKAAVKDWWSALAAVVTITGTTTAKTLPEVTIPGSGGNRLPAGATIQGAIPMVKFRKLKNTNATNANALSQAQHLQVRDDGGGSWHNFLTLPDGLLDIATATIEGGDLWIGNIDLSSTGYVDGADTYEFQIDEAHAQQDNLELRGIQTGIRVYYY